MVTIVPTTDPVLRGIATEIPDSLFGTPELQKLVDDMAEALDREHDGVAIAAPQVGLPYRIFLVRYDRIDPPQEGVERVANVGVYINPIIVKSSRRQQELDEGCLSVRGVYGKTIRYERATVEARKVDGSRFERGGGGVLAQAFQHEIDHLNGILFIDHAIELTEAPQRDSHALVD